MELPAQGWYRDPYAVHEDRYFSEGTPTKLVRDDGQESFDPPPDLPLPKDQLVPAELPGDEMADGADLHRADEASSGRPYDASAARRAALDVFDASAAT